MKHASTASYLLKQRRAGNDPNASGLRSPNWTMRFSKLDIITPSESKFTSVDETDLMIRFKRFSLSFSTQSFRAGANMFYEPRIVGCRGR